MNSRERTFRALNFEEPDRVPIDFWSSGGFNHKLESIFGLSREAFLDTYDVDLRYIDGPRYIGPPLREFSDSSKEDIWGVRRITVSIEMAHGKESYQEVLVSPLSSATSVDEINNYNHWPSPDWFDYSEIKHQCEQIQEKGRVAVFMGDRMNRIAQLKPAMYLRGVEKILLDMVMNPNIAKAVFDKVRRFYYQYAERIFESAESKLDIVLMGDDYGSQKGPLISPKMWVDFLGEGFAKYVDIAKSFNVRVMHHTCGSVRSIVPLMVQRGLDILQSLQPEASDMDLKRLKTDFGDCLTFHGGISIQKTLPFGTPEDVCNEVKDRINTLAKGGGYILCTSHNIQADTPFENVKALLDTYRKYGQYT